MKNIVKTKQVNQFTSCCYDSVSFFGNGWIVINYEEVRQSLDCTYSSNSKYLLAVQKHSNNHTQLCSWSLKVIKLISDSWKIFLAFQLNHCIAQVKKKKIKKIA